MPATIRASGNRRVQGDLLKVTLDLLILKTLAVGPAHGHTIAHAIERILRPAPE
jgi:DNA-binding PadR family transcriptional regulator